MANKHYEKEFKVHAVKLSYKLGSILSTAWELSVSPSTISRWRREYVDEGKNNISPCKNQKLRIKEVEDKDFFADALAFLWYLII